MTRVSIFFLLKQSFSLIRRDKILVAPPLIVSLLTFLFQPKESIELLLKPHPPLTLISFWFGICLAQLLTYCLVILMAHSVSKQQGLLIKEVFVRVVKRFFSLMGMVLVLLLVLGGVLWLLTLLSPPSFGIPLVTTILNACLQIIKVGAALLALLCLACLSLLLPRLLQLLLLLPLLLKPAHLEALVR